MAHHGSDQALRLKGDEVAAYVDARVQQKLANSFDSNGMATDADGKAEAQRATFSQPLRPGSIDHSIQAFVNRHPMMRAIMPFTKGPANVLRYGMNFTPLLNSASSEYRAAWRGAAGPEAQATAYGQMALGSLILGTAATLAAQGRLTGAAPADPVQAAQVKGVGWQPYSIVVGSGEDTKYISYGRFDPIAMPISIAADLIQTFHQQSAVQGIEHAVAAATIAVARAVNSKAYLTSLTNFLDSIASPTTTEQKAGRFLGNLAGNLVPGSAGLRGMTNTFTDGYLHDARGITDQLMAGLPGFSTSVPRAYNMLGEPMLAPALIYNATKQDVVDRELERMTLELGGDDGSATAAFAKMPPGLAGHADARTITMADGANAYERMQQLSSRPTPASPTLRDEMRRVIETPAYAGAPDGYASTLGTKQWMLAKPIATYRETAKRIVMADPKVAAAAHKALVDVTAAAATKRADPAGASGQAKVLQNLGKGFGVDLSLTQP